MGELTAEYSVPIDAPMAISCMVQAESNWSSEHRFPAPGIDVAHFQLDAFRVRLTFMVGPHLGPPTKASRMVCAVTGLLVEISSDRATNVVDEGIEQEYHAAFKRVVEGFIQFNRFVKKNTQFRRFEELQQVGRDNAGWTFDGRMLPTQRIRLEMVVSSGNPYTAGEVPQLQAYLMERPAVPLHEQLLADATDALDDRDLRRATVDLAIACEVLVKTTLFKSDALAGAVVEQLEESNLLRVTIKELMAAAGRAFGETLSEVDSDAHQEILRLFEVRNRIVHHGSMEKKIGGKRIPLERGDVKRWLGAVRTLENWLDRNSRALRGF